MRSRQKLLEPVIGDQSVSKVLRRRSKRKPKTDDLLTGEVREYKGGDVLKPLLKGPVLDPFRHGDYLHVSDLIYTCPRKIVIAKRFNRPIKSQALFDSQGITFAIGNALHDYIRNKIRDTQPEYIYGTWKCPCDRTSFLGTRSQAIEQGNCNHCNKDMYIYNELQVVNEDLGITGSLDLSLLIDSALLITEIKSMSKRLWDELIRPVPEHLVQVLLYWYFAREHGYALHDKVSIIYAVKEWMFGNPYKEFVFKPSVMMHRLEEYLEDAALLREALDNKDAKLPPRIICPRRDAPAAKKCEQVSVCFGVEE